LEGNRILERYGDGGDDSGGKVYRRGHALSTRRCKESYPRPRLGEWILGPRMKVPLIKVLQ